jgi:hypothetical protein
MPWIGRLFGELFHRASIACRPDTRVIAAAARHRVPASIASIPSAAPAGPLAISAIATTASSDPRTAHVQGTGAPGRVNRGAARGGRWWARDERDRVLSAREWVDRAWAAGPAIPRKLWYGQAVPSPGCGI